MIATGLGGRGAQHRGRSAFYDQQLEAAQAQLLRLSGAECQRAFTNVGGRRLHYLTSGHGPALVLLHGASGGAANWYRLFPALSRRWRVFAPDLPGFGFSDAIESHAPLGRQVGSVVAEWLHTIGVRRANVVGTSFGGLAALRLSQYFDVGRIIAIDTVGLEPKLPLLLRLGTLPIIARVVSAPSRAGTRWLLRHVLTAGGLPREHEAALVDYLFASARRADGRLLAQAFVQFAGLSGQRDVLTSEELSHLARRLLVVWGERDNFLPLRRVADLCTLAGCRAVRIIPGAGHSPNWEQPERVIHEIENFLSEHAES